MFAVPNKIRLLSGTANEEFTEKIHQTLKPSSLIIEADIGYFPDGETNVRIKETVRGYNIYFIQSTCPPVNDNLMQVALVIDALVRASAQSVTAVIPYFGYARQDKKQRGRVPISAKRAARIIEDAGAYRVVSMDFHAGSIQGFFEIPADNLSPVYIFTKHLLESIPILKNIVIVSPDIGGVFRANNLAEQLKVPLAIIYKRRDEVTNESKVVRIVGEVRGKVTVLVDDILSTGKTLADDAQALIDEGAKQVIAAVTHGVFTGNAMDVVENSRLQRVMVGDTIRPPEQRSSKIEVVSVTSVFANTIKRIHEKGSVSDLFVCL